MAPGYVAGRQVAGTSRRTAPGRTRTSTGRGPIRSPSAYATCPGASSRTVEFRVEGRRVGRDDDVSSDVAELLVEAGDVREVHHVALLIGYGAAAALSLSIGMVLLLVGLLRFLQAEWPRSASGNLSWLAYLITLLVAVGIIALAISRVKKATLNKEPK